MTTRPPRRPLWRPAAVQKETAAPPRHEAAWRLQAQPFWLASANRPTWKAGHVMWIVLIVVLVLLFGGGGGYYYGRGTRR